MPNNPHCAVLGKMLKTEEKARTLNWVISLENLILNLMDQLSYREQQGLACLGMHVEIWLVFVDVHSPYGEGKGVDGWVCTFST